MPWEPHFNQAEAHAAIEGATTWTEVLAVLEYTYHGKNIQTVREWADRWGISTQHLPDRRGRRPRYSPDELRHAIASSASWADTLRRLGYCPTGGNWKTLKRRARELGISTNHFDPYAASRRRRPAQRFPLGEVWSRVRPTTGKTSSADCTRRAGSSAAASSAGKASSGRG